MKSYWIKKRFNPQLEKPYFFACGRLSKAAAKRKEGSLFGFNVMFEYKTEAEYNKALEEIKVSGHRVIS